MLDEDPTVRQLIAAALGKTVDRAVQEHCSGITQEAPLTARIGQALEGSLDGQPVLGRRIRIVTQDIPDRGPGALEKALGADLYVGIEVGRGKGRETKGFLVQAKLRRNLTHSKERVGLEQDCKDMLARSRSSYVWLYGDNGVRVLEAQQVVDTTGQKPQNLPARRVTTLFARVLECSEGAPDLGLPDVRDGTTQMRTALGEMLLQLRVSSGLAVSID